jgi:hypothetical protein
MESADTSCSSVQGLDDMIKNDKIRYVRKGYGLILAILIALAYFITGPLIMKWIWPVFDGLTRNYFKIYFIFLKISNIIGLYPYNTCSYIIRIVG